MAPLSYYVYIALEPKRIRIKTELFSVSAIDLLSIWLIHEVTE